MTVGLIIVITLGIIYTLGVVSLLFRNDVSETVSRADFKPDANVYNFTQPNKRV
jgi:hypothetical protein